MLQSSSNSESDEWVEMETKAQASRDREDWMAMTGMLKTYTKEDIKPKQEEKEKKNIDSYNPSTSSRELNPYWKQGGTGLPQAPVRNFKKPSDDDDYYSKSSRNSRSVRDYDDYSSKSTNSREYNSDSYHSKSNSKAYKEPLDDDYYSSKSNPNKSRDDHYHNSHSSSRQYSSSYNRSSGGWRRGSEDKRDLRNEHSKQDPDDRYPREKDQTRESQEVAQKKIEPPEGTAKLKDSKYLSDEKMNKVAAKIVKAEIMGDTKLVAELKAKLEEAREYRKQNPNTGKEEEDDGIMLMSTNALGNSRPLSKTAQGDARSKGGKRKAETHSGGERQKYFGNDDKYNLAQMVSYLDKKVPEQ